MLFRNVFSLVTMALLTTSLVFGCASVQTQSKEVIGRVPLADAVAALPAPAIWENFQDITQVPRPSHLEGKATAFVADFGRRLGLETVVDAVGNVIIRKPATAGMENSPGVVLQAHLDMVPQRTSASVAGVKYSGMDMI